MARLNLNNHKSMRKKIIFPLMALSVLALTGAGCIGKNALLTNSNGDSRSPQPSILVSDQSLEADNQLLIDGASLDDDGWIVIYEKKDGRPESILGYSSLFKGKTAKTKIFINKTKLSPSLIAVLHYDRGEKGIFESPGADGPVIKNQQIIMKDFNILNYAEIAKNPSQTPAIARKEFIITAKQWSFSPSVIKVKKGDAVMLKLKSLDVAHSLVIREFKINAAIKPNEIKTVEFTANKAGVFTSVCGVYCGVGHVGMTGTLIVEE
jgi:cytochrome c oxidase subunit II